MARAPLPGSFTVAIHRSTMTVGAVPEARVGAALRQAWTNMWPHFWWLLLFGVIEGMASNIRLGEPWPGEVRLFVNSGGALLAIFLGAPLGIGLTKAHLAASRGERPTWQDFGYAFGPRYWQSVLLGLLVFLIVIGGLILLIVPGIYWGVKMAFTSQRFIEDDLRAVDAIKASFADTKGHWWPVFGMALLALLLLVAGVLALLVGFFVAMVLVPQMFVVYWRALVQAPGGVGSGVGGGVATGPAGDA